MAHADQDFLAVAERAARAAGEHALRAFGSEQTVSARTRNDVKLQMDCECQQIAEAVIREAYPGHAILGEEGDGRVPDAEFLWIIDPLDGTVNYFNGLPHWCSSVALRRDREVLAGAVYAPKLGECFAATRGGPALCNGRPIRVTATDQLEHAMVLTGVSGILADTADRLDRFGQMLAHTSKVRVLGAAALDLCFVAAGRADGLFEYSLHLWDFAAGRLIVERAGGVFEPIAPIDALRCGCLCTNGRIHSALRDVLLPYPRKPYRDD